MPRSEDDILESGDALARRFEEYEPRPEDRRDPAALLALQAAPGQPEHVIARAVADARAAGYSWRIVGWILRLPPEAARQSYGDSDSAT